MRVAVVLLLVTVAAAAADAQTLEPACPVSRLVNDSAPHDTADPIVGADWYINGGRTIWAGPVPAGGWPAGGVLYRGTQQVRGQKTYWVRPRGEQLVITGRRLDAPSPPLEADIPCCYTSGFQIVALHFPTAGCWEVSARAGDQELRFVTQVRARD